MPGNTNNSINFLQKFSILAMWKFINHSS